LVKKKEALIPGLYFIPDLFLSPGENKKEKGEMNIGIDPAIFVGKTTKISFPMSTYFSIRLLTMNVY
jgi:hypothetical protein